MSGPYLQGKKCIIANFHDTITKPGIDNLPEKRIADYWIDECELEGLEDKRDKCMELVRRGDQNPNNYDYVTKSWLEVGKGKPLSEEVAVKAGVRECVSEQTREAVRRIDEETDIEMYIVTNCPDDLVRWTLGDDCAGRFKGIVGNKVYCQNGVCVGYNFTNRQEKKQETIDRYARSLRMEPAKTLCVGKYPFDAGYHMPLVVVANGNESRRLIAEDQKIPTIKEFSNLLDGEEA